MDKIKRTGKDALLAKSNNTALAMIQKAQAQELPAKLKTQTSKKAQDDTLPKAEEKARTRLNLRILTSVREPAEKAARMNQKSLTEVIEELLREYAERNADKIRKYDEIFK